MRDSTDYEGAALLWPETVVGMVATVPCPTMTGFATRSCDSAGLWLHPDTSACVNVIKVITEFNDNNMVRMGFKSTVILAITIQCGIQ